MKLDIKGVHYEITDVTREFIDQKLEKLRYASDMIVDLMLVLEKETKDWKAEAKVNFRWGAQAHLDETDINLHAAIERLVHRLDQKVSKEKEKIKDHHPHNHEPKKLDAVDE